MIYAAITLPLRLPRRCRYADITPPLFRHFYCAIIFAFDVFFSLSYDDIYAFMPPRLRFDAYCCHTLYMIFLPLFAAITLDD